MLSLPWNMFVPGSNVLKYVGFQPQLNNNIICFVCSSPENIKEDPPLYRIPTESSYSTLKQQEYGFFLWQELVVVVGMLSTKQSNFKRKRKLETDVEIFKMHFAFYVDDFPMGVVNSFNLVIFV